VLAKNSLSAIAAVAHHRRDAHDIGTVDGISAGQVLDRNQKRQKPTAGDLEYIHRSKTGALITASLG